MHGTDNMAPGPGCRNVDLVNDVDAWLALLEVRVDYTIH